MMLKFAAPLVLSLLFAAPGVAAPIDDLVKEEARLADAARTLGPAEGIASLFADNVRLYARGGPYKGRAAALDALKANPTNAGKAARWHSIKSGISSDGTHGFTFGYLAIDGGDPKAANRRYLAYWVKGPAGWRVAALKQALVAPGEATIDVLPRSIPERPGSGDANDADSLKAAEQAFSDRAQVIGLGPAFAEKGRADAINSGPSGVIVGPTAIGAVVDPDGAIPSALKWSADEVLVAPSGDLGVTFGMLHPTQAAPAGTPPAIPFFTIWMRDGPGQPWRYVAE